MRGTGGGFHPQSFGVADRPVTDGGGMPAVPVGYRRAAVRMVASQSTDAAECVRILAMLGLTAEMGVIRAEAA